MSKLQTHTVQDFFMQEFEEKEKQRFIKEFNETIRPRLEEEGITVINELKMLLDSHGNIQQGNFFFSTGSLNTEAILKRYLDAILTESIRLEDKYVIQFKSVQLRNYLLRLTKDTGDNRLVPCSSLNAEYNVKQFMTRFEVLGYIQMDSTTYNQYLYTNKNIGEVLTVEYFEELLNQFREKIYHCTLINNAQEREKSRKLIHLSQELLNYMDNIEVHLNRLK